LLDLREKLFDISIQDKFADFFQWYLLLWPYFCGIKDVEFKIMLLGLWNDLDTKLPLGKHPVLDSFVEVLAVEI